jgi:hypothetical protein
MQGCYERKRVEIMEEKLLACLDVRQRDIKKDAVFFSRQMACIVP